MKNPELPLPGSYWRNAYEPFKVLLVANAHTKARNYPTTIIFMGNGGTVWSVPVSKWFKMVRSGLMIADATAFIDAEGEDNGIPG